MEYNSPEEKAKWQARCNLAVEGNMDSIIANISDALEHIKFIRNDTRLNNLGKLLEIQKKIIHIPSNANHLLSVAIVRATDND